MVYSINKNKFFYLLNNFIVFLYFLSNTLLFYNGNIFFSILMFLVIPVYFIQKIKNDINSILESVFLFVLYFFLILTNLYTKNMEYGWVFDFQYIFVILFLINKKIHRNIFFSLIVIYFCIVIKDICSGVDVNKLLAKGSRNIVSAISINLTLLYYFLCNIQKKRFSLIPVFLNLILCFISIGRSGILIGLILSGSIISYYFYNGNKKQRFLVFLLFIAVVIFFNIKFDYNTFNLFSRFTEKGMNSDARTLLKNEYHNITNNNLRYFLFGVKLRSSNLFVRYNLNVHNSFLSLHCNYGLVGFVMVLFLFFVSAIKLFFSRNYFILILLFCALLRVYVDSIAFPGFYDIAIFSMFFYPYRFCASNKCFIRTKNILIGGKKI